MSFSLIRRVSLSACATLLACIAASPVTSAQTAPAAPQYDVVFDVNGNQYTGATTFNVDAAGKVTGTMKLSQPATVDAKLNGEIKAGTWTFNYPFTMDNQGQPCSGTLSGTAKVTADKAEATGSVSIGGNCTTDPLSGTFSFKKRAK